MFLVFLITAIPLVFISPHESKTLKVNTIDNYGETSLKNLHYGSIVGILLNVDQFLSHVPSISEYRNDLKNIDKIRGLEMQVSRLNPILQCIASFLSKSTDADNYKNRLQSLLNDLKNSIEGIKFRVDKVVSEYHGVVPLRIKILKDNIDDAFKQLNCVNVNIRKIEVHPVEEKFVINDYIPLSEKLYILRRKVQAAEKSRGDLESIVKKLIPLWNIVHDGVKQSSLNLLDVIDRVENSIRRNMDYESMQNLQAVLNLFNKKSRPINLLHFLDKAIMRLQSLRTNLLKIADRVTMPIHQRKSLLKLPEAISMISMLESMTEKLSFLYEQSHSHDNKLKFLLTRYEKSKRSPSNQALEQNNELRIRLNRLKNDVELTLNDARLYFANLLIFNNGRKPVSLDVVSLIKRFMDLSSQIKKTEGGEKFNNDLEVIQNYLQELVESNEIISDISV